MAELVATMVVGPLVAMVKEKASSYLLDQYKVMKGMEEQHKILKRKLPAILDVIADAEQAASHREGVRAWLDEVKTVTYEANEVFDEFKYEALRRQAKKEGHYTKLGFDVIKLFPTHNRFIFRNRMGNKLRKIVQAIEVLVAEMNAFGFKYQQQASASKQWRQTDSIIVDPEDIVSRSRDKEKHEIVSRLIDPANTANLMVLPIFGMGGLGKTTLAQLIYNDPDVQKYFQLQRWVCVSENFDVCDLALKICQGPCEKDNEKALQKIRTELSGMRYLLVLDDVWNRDPDKWEKLKACLRYGGAGSVVLVTTRYKEIAELMGKVEAHDIAVLDKEFLKEIIEKRAFSLHRSKPELLQMVGLFADRCHGSPLAAKALGSVLRTKTNQEEWEAVLHESIICNEESGILPILKLSYDELPSYMKQCFAFCAIFPKDYEIDVDKLIQLWIANGFIQEQKVHPETTGKRILDELASRSFFQDVKKVPIEGIERTGGWCYSRTTCKIHDLMHDVALSTMEKECVVATETPSQIDQWLPNTARHLFLSCRRPHSVLNKSLATRSPAIQTLLCAHYEGSLHHLSKYSSLRALRLSTLSSLFPLKPMHLHHLRYLDLSQSWIEALPEDISILYNLQTLNLSDCFYLRRLPRQMKYMTALRHLYTHGCPKLKSMPPGLGKLMSLQTLTCFVAGKGSDCSYVGELQHLNLGGQLKLHQLENVTEEDAKKANIGEKKELKELTLQWTVGCGDARVLEGLKPHNGLQAVRIGSYGGTTFPTWMAMLQNMVEIHLFRCANLQCLFRSDTSFTFPNLKEITLKDLQSVERWWEINSAGHGEEIMFPELEKLTIIDCEKLTALPQAALLSESSSTMVRSAFPALKVLELKHLKSFQRWEAVEGTEREYITFPQLEKLSIEICPALTALSEAPFPALKVLELKYLKSFQCWEAMEGTQRQEIMFPQLEKLTIIDCEKLTALPQAALLSESSSTMVRSAFPALKVLELKYLKSFQRWEAVEGTEREYITFPQLEKLSIETCPALTALSEAPFPALKVLELKYLKSFQCWEAMEGTQRQEIMFPQLENLLIVGCGKLIALPGEPTFPNLQNVCIKECPELRMVAKSPTLSVLAMEECEEDLMFMWVARHMTSLTDLKLNYWTISAMGEHSFTKLVYSKQKGNVHVMELTGLMSASKKGMCTDVLCAFFVQLQKLVIQSCNELVHWPEKEFQSLVSLRKLKIESCNKLSGYAQAAPPEPSTSSETSQLLPRLESLKIIKCESLVEVFNVPASLRRMVIDNCSKVESIFGRKTGAWIQVSYVSEVSSSVDGAPRDQLLESLHIRRCGSLTGALDLPLSLKTLYLFKCDGLRSLESRSGELPSLEDLYICDCKNLSSLPDGPQAYSSLQRLLIEGCPGIKTLPACLQQRLGSLEEEYLEFLDPRYQAPWKYIRRLKSLVCRSAHDDVPTPPV